jgi:hypothetical protein
MPVSPTTKPGLNAVKRCRLERVYRIYRCTIAAAGFQGQDWVDLPTVGQADLRWQQGKSMDVSFAAPRSFESSSSHGPSSIIAHLASL